MSCVVREAHPQHVGVEQIPRAARLHRRASTLLDANETAALEQLQPLANDGAAEAELLAERRLGRKHVARREHAADDLVAERLEDDRREPRRALLQVRAALGDRVGVGRRVVSTLIIIWSDGSGINI